MQDAAGTVGDLDRREVVKRLLARRGEALVVSGLGSPSYDVHAAGDDPNNYYLWGAMGAAALVGLGLAQAHSRQARARAHGRRRAADGLGGLVTIAVARPRNLTWWCSTTATSARPACSRATRAPVWSGGRGARRRLRDNGRGDEPRGARERAVPGTRSDPPLHGEGEGGEPPRSLPSRDAVFIKNRLRSALGLGDPA